MKKLLILVIIIISLTIGALGYSILTKPTTIVLKPIQKIAVSPENMIKSSPPTTASESPLVFANPSYTIDAFETAIPEKNWFDLKPVMADKVTVIKYSTSCCGLITKDQAVNEMFYLNQASRTWDFDENSAINKQIAQKDADNFGKAFIGTSSNYYAVGIELNDDLYISKIVLVNDYRIITGQ